MELGLVAYICNSKWSWKIKSFKVSSGKEEVRTNLEKKKKKKTGRLRSGGLDKLFSRPSISK
jgi:hypothetical protein